MAKAKQQLQQCGKPNGFNHQHRLPERPAAGDARSPGAAAGAGDGRHQATLQGYPAARYYTNFAGVPDYVHSARHRPAGVGGWGATGRTAYGFLTSCSTAASIVPAGNTNIAEINDPAVNNLFIQLAQTTDATSPDQRSGQQIDKQVMADAVILPIGVRQGAAVPAAER